VVTMHWVATVMMRDIPATSRPTSRDERGSLHVGNERVCVDVHPTEPCTHVVRLASPSSS
jgi:hypothetical protein